MSSFSTMTTSRFKDLVSLLDSYHEKDNPQLSSPTWAFRGQYCVWTLSTSLERALDRSCIKKEQFGYSVEQEMIRDFQRYYDDDDKEWVEKDKLYCLSRMQHYGAPTRLLDWTYSRWVAIYNALECAFDNNTPKSQKMNFAVWCLNLTWCHDAAEKTLIDQLKRSYTNEKWAQLKVHEFVRDRDWEYSTVTVPTDRDIFYFDEANPYQFVLPENPFKMHKRINIQQGCFLCTGDISRSFEDNLGHLDGHDKKENLLKIYCEMDRDDFQKAFIELRRMNITRATLYPGLDGWAQSFKYGLHHYKNKALINQNRKTPRNFLP